VEWVQLAQHWTVAGSCDEPQAPGATELVLLVVKTGAIYSYH
jgi:hypothetical protein